MGNRKRRKYFTNRKILLNNRSHIRGKCTEPDILQVSIPLGKLKQDLHLTLLTKQLQTSNLPLGWSVLNTAKVDDHLYLCHMKIIEGNPVFCYTVDISYDLTYSVKAFNHFITLPQTTLIDNCTSIINLLQYITSLKICPGISYPKYIQLAQSRGGTLSNREGINKSVHWSHVHVFFLHTI